MLAPWTPAAFLGLGLTYRAARTEKTSPERFLWCWAILVPLVFSIPEGKNHHYLLHALAPWAILGTLGILRIHEWCRNCPAFFRRPSTICLLAAVPISLALFFARHAIAGPAWLPALIGFAAILFLGVWTWGVQHPSHRMSAQVVFLLVAGCYVGVHWVAGHHADRHRYDVAFLRSVDGQCTEDMPILVDLDVEALRAFLCLFYLPEDSVPLHNLSFITNEPQASGEVYLLTRERKIADVPNLERFRIVAQSEHTGGETSAEDRLTLFRCTLKAKDPSAPQSAVRVSPMQAMFREPGPNLR
jgi:4-amino-4-deoxy-L-arabinose transferase-like glycosyltransferase